MFIRNALVTLLGLALIVLVGAAVEGRPGWVYAATGAFMVVGVALALHSAMVSTRPGAVLKAAGFRPTRRAHTWRAVVADVPVEALVQDGVVRFRPAGLPDGLSILPGASEGRGTGDPDFDAVAQCRGRSAELAALGPDVRASLIPLIEVGARVEGGALSVPVGGGLPVMQAASEAAARLAQIHHDLRAALRSRATLDPPHLALPAVLALAAGWPDDAVTQAHLDDLLGHPDPMLRLAAAEASRSADPAVLDALIADAGLPAAVRVRALTAQIAHASSAQRRARLAACLDTPMFCSAALALAAKHGVALPLDALVELAQAGGPTGRAATTGLQMHGEAAEPALIALTAQPDAAVRSAALAGLGRVGTLVGAAHLEGDADPAAVAALARIRLRVGT